MSEINDKDLENVGGGVGDIDRELLHESGDVCGQYEPYPDNPLAGMVKKCVYCAHALAGAAVGVWGQKVYCTLGVKKNN